MHIGFLNEGNMNDHLFLLLLCCVVLLFLFLLKQKWDRDEKIRLRDKEKKEAKRPPTKEKIFYKNAHEQIEKDPELSSQLYDLNYEILAGNAGDVYRQIVLTVLYERSRNNQLEKRVAKLEQKFKRG
jgi:hypothetical protein